VGVKSMQAYRFGFDLTPSQERAVLAHAGAGRKAYNWALARVKAVMDQRAAERSYGLADDALTPALSWSLPALRKAWNAAKGEVAPWWRECSKEAFNTGLDALARGLKNWSGSRTGKRAGRKVGFPRFKAKHRTTPTVRFTTGTIRVEPDRKHVVLPRLGRLNCTSPPANSPADSRPAPHGSCPRRSAVPAGVGSSRSRWRSSAPFGSPRPGRWSG
jgi:transposase